MLTLNTFFVDIRHIFCFSIDFLCFNEYNNNIERKRNFIMMTKEQLKERIEKKNKDITKINKRIEKWSKTWSNISLSCLSTQNTKININGQ